MNKRISSRSNSKFILFILTLLFIVLSTYIVVGQLRKLINSSLTGEIKSLSLTASKIEEEVEKYQKITNEAEQRRQLTTSLVNINKEQIDTISAAVEKKVAEENSRQFKIDIFKDVMIAALFFFLGLLFERKKREKQEKSLN